MLENVVEITRNCVGIRTSNIKIMVCSAKEFLQEERREEFCLTMIPK